MFYGCLVTRHANYVSISEIQICSTEDHSSKAYEGGSICNENPYITPSTNARVRIFCHMPNERSKRRRYNGA